jgi:HAD superfamily hydrolase (TIGR01549 family)
MVIGSSLKKLVIFDLDGTLFDLSVDWDDISNFVKTHSSQEEIEVYVRAAELKGVQTGKSVEGARHTLDILSTNHYLAIVSRNFNATISAAIRAIGFEGSIFYLGRDNVSEQKPNPEGVYKILEYYGVEAEDAVLVGDTSHDVDAAKNVGVCSIILKNPKNKFIPEGANEYISSLNDLVKVAN